MSTIGPGILALIGVCQDDTPEHMDLLTKKILQLKLWPEGARVVDGVLAPGDEHARAWRSNVMELGGDDADVNAPSERCWLGASAIPAIQVIHAG